MYRSVPKLVPTCSSGQLRSRRRHQSHGSCYRQSKIVSQARKKDSTINAAAAEPGDAYYAREDEEKLAPNKTHAIYIYNVQDNAVKAWLIDPYT